VREEVKEWMQQAHQSVTTLLKDNWHLVTALADALKKENLLFTEDIQQVIVSAGFKTGCERKNKHAIH
jgi:ATP-dependent Zn protease